MALRELNVAIDLSGDASDALSELDREVDQLRDSLGATIETVDMFSESAAASFEDLGASMLGSTDQGNAGLKRLADSLGVTELEMQGLIDKAQNELHLEEEFKAAAEAAGLTDAEIKKLNKSLDVSTKSANGFGGVLKGIAAAGVIAFAASYASASLDAFTALEQQRVQVENLAGSEYPKLGAAIDRALENSQGLSSEGSLKTAANQALSMGASVDFVADSLSGLQQVSAVTGRDLGEVMKNAQEAIISGSDEFLKKNGAVFGQYQSQFKAIGTGADATSKRMREALIMTALKENSALTEQYARHMDTAGARAKILDERFGDLREIIGEMVAVAIKPLQLALISLLTYFTDSEDGANRVKFALIVLAGTLTAIMIPTVYSMVIAGYALMVAWAPVIAIMLGIGLAIAAVVLVVDELLTWMDGGDSIIGDFLGPWKDFDLAKLFKGMLDKVLNLVKTYGKWVIMALFPVSALYFFWDDIVAFISGIPGKIIAMFESMKESIKNLLKDILPESFLNGLKSIGIDLSGGATNVNDAIITKEGKVIHTHPDDNLYAFKELPGASAGSSNNSGGSSGLKSLLSFNIEKIILGSGSTEEDAKDFVSMIEEQIDDKIVPKLRQLLGLPEDEFA
jgi:Flp pilus assembly pilin Flp